MIRELQNQLYLIHEIHFQRRNLLLLYVLGILLISHSWWFHTNIILSAKYYNILIYNNYCTYLFLLLISIVSPLLIDIGLPITMYTRYTFNILRSAKPLFVYSIHCYHMNYVNTKIMYIYNPNRRGSWNHKWREGAHLWSVIK